MSRPKEGEKDIHLCCEAIKVVGGGTQRDLAKRLCVNPDALSRWVCGKRALPRYIRASMRAHIDAELLRAQQTAPEPTESPAVPARAAQTDWGAIVSAVMFEGWWVAYPRQRRAAKSQCWAKWRSLSWADRQAAHGDVTLAGRGTMDVSWMQGFCPAPLVYLRQERWQEDWRARDEAQQRNHGGFGPRPDGNSVVERAIAANAAKLG